MLGVPWMDRHQLGDRQLIVGGRHHQEVSAFWQGQDEAGGGIQLPLPPSNHHLTDGGCQFRVGQADFCLSGIEDLHRYSLPASVSMVGSRPTSPFAQASRLARLAVVGFEAIARAALVPEDVGLVSEDRVAG